MAEDINPAVIKHTQETLGKYVKKPNLSEKLLKKPPFRFLHDVFAVVIRETGCFEGLYSPEELNSDNIKDRDDKMHFLQKMIDVVRICTNVPLTVKTSKIVAGHEAEKTNELLQLMGKIIENKLNWQPAVEQVLKGKEIKSPVEKPKEKAEKPKDKEVAKSKDSTTKAKREINKLSKQASEEKTKRPKERQKSITPTTAKEKNSTKPGKAEDKGAAKKSKESAARKLSKADSQSSHKSISPNKEVKTTKNRENTTPMAASIQCSHEEEQEPQRKEAKMKSSIASDNLGTVNDKKAPNPQNEDPFGPSPAQEEKMEHSLFGGDDKAFENNDISPKRQTESASRRSSGKLKKSPKKVNNEISQNGEENNSISRNSSAKSKINQNLMGNMNEALTPVPDDKDSIKRKSSSGKSKPLNDFSLKEANSEADMKTQPKETTINKDPENNFAEKPLANTNTKAEPPATPVAIAAGIVNNEVKRESTFTRENSKDLPNKTNRPRTSLRPPSARPPSARPGAPRRRDRNIEIILQPNDQIKMSGIQVKLENFGDLDDDGENLVIIENSDAANVEQEMMGALKTEAQTESEPMEQQGHLVQQILETQKELTQQKDFNQQIKNEKDSVNGMVMKQTSMNNLRDVIQGLTKSVNPLGKLMDFIPEDIDAMQLEFTMWRDTYTQAANQLKREKSLTESATEPMKNQLLQIESSIQEYMEMIDASRVKILQNNDKILKMLRNS
ncbi:TRAF3-interacting protein 1 [Stomoxys calcitrans]|uniref:TRAF3-interacting protein 1 n=1 Tax=Stomoxys calcitrans TaxID=35570 RepID=UPI0027E2D5D3|nr:TRAF3-interacting protein 1 [Stomoxys calcitrans]